MKKINRQLVVCFDNTKDPEGVLIVGERRPSKTVPRVKVEVVVAAYRGKEAVDLYNKLMEGETNGILQ